MNTISNTMTNKSTTEPSVLRFRRSSFCLYYMTCGFYHPWYCWEVASVDMDTTDYSTHTHWSCFARVLHAAKLVHDLWCEHVRRLWCESMLHFRVFSFCCCVCWLILQWSPRQKLILWDVCENCAVTVMCFAQHSGNTCPTRLDQCTLFYSVTDRLQCWVRVHISIMLLLNAYNDSFVVCDVHISLYSAGWAKSPWTHVGSRI